MNGDSFRTGGHVSESARSRTLSRKFIELQEAERRRLARELHDEVGQALTAVKISLQAVQRAHDPAQAASLVEEGIGIVERAIQAVRNLSLSLRPAILDDLGLVAALRWHVDRQAQMSGIRMTLSSDPALARLPAEIETTCFRVVQEAVSNAMRHSHATRLDIALRPEGQGIGLFVRDKGRGFHVAEARSRALAGTSLGLLGMEERVDLVGGRLEVLSDPGKGTEVQAYIPLPGRA
jgi:signal transduction histidine kinase